MTQELLVARAKAGDESAFAVLVEENQKKVYALALRMVGDPEDAADLAQEAFLSAWKGLPRFQGTAAFSTWLYRLTTNACIDFLRREARRKRTGSMLSLDDAGDGDSLELPDDRTDPHRALEEQQTREQFAQAMAKLSEEHRRVLALREVAGLSYAQIADLLGVEEGTVKSRIARARLALRKKLLDAGNFSP